MERSRDGSYTQRVEHSSDPMIDIRIRISRKLILWVTGIILLFFVLSWLLMTGGHSSGGLDVRTIPEKTPAQQRSSP